MSVRKTITVTYQNALNYGAVLQAYALHQHLSKLGIDDKLLDLKKSHKVFNKIEFNKHLPGNIYANMLSLCHILETKRRIKHFREFVARNMNTTSRYETAEEIVSNPPIADAYITGSDQTFNTYWGIKPERFLRFGSAETKRISYASSMGGVTVKDEYLDEFISAIKAYSFVSTREQSDADYISKLCSVPCSVNVDPVFLLAKDAWSRLASNSGSCATNNRGKYILVYELLENSLLNDVAMKIKERTGFEIVVISPGAICRVKGDLIVRDAGPLEFLKLYNNAEYVLTTSFHGTCFALIFEKKFFSFIRKAGETRITNILDMLNLSERIITDTNEITFTEIPYDTVKEKIELQRTKATEYLKEALGI